ncbi:hypothetical protein D910_07079 [Dendroctonus ponderosae]
MRLVHFMLSTGKIRLGALDGDNIIDLNSHANWVPIDLVRFLHEHENAYEKLKLTLTLGGQYVLCKNMDHFCPIGPCLVTKDEIPDPHNLFAKTWVNGVLKQNGNTRNLLFKIDELIEHLSSVLTLLPGDLICTGTPSGVGETRSPPEFLKPGDVLTSEIEGVGKLKNYVVDYESHIILKL